ncbi:hypothetical protein DFR29_12216 [Tahibacter aquaticus]|uniref:Uncharacterized protein n=1 Tax=Tahibacter aquaticus TaxID=520092 RepID=A0A4R6YM42_9GAMM|nr:hypothetical protein [Tahibacter aquaticus]TDR38216.1 hypothetical protein DFR29_12216 [Tahibacter aquaticus]
MRPLNLQLSVFALACAFPLLAPAQPAAKPAATPAVTADEAEIALAVADLDLYQRGLQLEIDALRLAQQRLAAAREARDDVSESAALQPVLTRQYERNAAKSLNVDLRRYRAVKQRLGDILVLGEYIDQLNAQLEQLHQTGVSAKQRADQRKQIEDLRAKAIDPYAVLDVALRDALKQRADALVRMRINNRDLLQELTSR